MKIPYDFPSDEARNKWLLYHFLKKSYSDLGIDDKKAEELTEKRILDNSNNLFGYHGLAWQLGQISLEFFCLYFLQDIYLPKEDNAAAPLAPVHEELWHDIQDSIIGNGPEQIGRILPRGTGKSAFGTLGPSIWSMAYKHKTYVLICSDIGSTAEKFIKDIKDNVIDNEYIKFSFGKLLDDGNKDYKCNATQLEFTNYTFVESISSTSPMRGRKYKNIRPDLIILDDYQSEDDVRTEEAREKKWKRYSDDVKFAKQRPVKRDGVVIKKGTVLMAWGTQQHKECFYSKLIKSATWSFKRERGVNVNDIDNFFNEGLWKRFKQILTCFNIPEHLENAKEFYYANEKEMQFDNLWPQFWDCLDLALDYYENPSSFKQEVQNDVNSIGEKWFKSMHTETRKEINNHNFVATMLIVDPAAGGGKKNDYSAYMIGSKTEKYKYCRYGELAKINARTEFDKYVDHMIELLIKYGDITHVYIEKNTFNGADANQLEKKVQEHLQLKFRNITIINEAQKKNKDDKISTIIPYINRGEFIFCAEDEEFNQQILDFTGQKYSIHDDAPDSAAEFWIRVDQIKVTKGFSVIYR